MAADPPPANPPIVPPAPPAPALLAGNDEVPDGISEDDSMFRILYWIGFVLQPQRIAIVQDSIDSYESIRSLGSTDISDMATAFGNRSVAQGKIVFGTKRTKLLKALVFWTHDYIRISKVPTIVGLSEVTFLRALTTALSRDEVRTHMKSQAKASAEVAYPGMLENERAWKTWEEKFLNYLRCHIGVNGVPLSYVIRENDNPDHATNYADFVNQTIACAPLNGDYFTADSRTVFQLIVSFTTGQPSNAWINGTIRQADGRTSMQSLRNHFAGEGNTSRSKAEADRLYDSLHYRNERSMSFEIFLTQCQKMFNIFEKEKEPMTDDAKVRFLFF